MVQEDLVVTLSLGCLEVSATDLIRLREGMQIEFEKPCEMKGAIQVDGVDWAFVTVNLSEGNVSLKVDHLAYERKHFMKNTEL